MTMDSSACKHIDNTFGPHAKECRGGFDFTLLFEEILLSIVPSALLLLLGSFRILYSLKKPPKVIFTSWLPAKQVTWLYSSASRTH